MGDDDDDDDDDVNRRTNMPLANTAPSKEDYEALVRFCEEKTKDPTSS